MTHHNPPMGQVLTTATDDPGGAGLHSDADDTQTQQATQEATQEANGRASQQDDEHGRARRCWGFLQPCSRTMIPADFLKVHPTYTIGRASECHIRLRGNKVSNAHCLIKWDGRDERDAVVTVTDTSSNGTFINGEKIGRGNSRILREGNEIAFGTPQPGPPEDDYRFIYRQITGGPAQGLWAEYDMGSELGKGSFATVFGALHRKTGTWHAVKIIQLSKIKPGPGAQVDANGKVKNPFQREITVMENLRHRNICRMKEVFIEPDTLDIVLELVKGGDLLDRILKSGGLPEEETRDIVYQMCDALAYVHSQGIAHRDLKPENILLTDDEPPIVKVADFGLAKIADSMTMLRTMCGTPSYLAPEVVDQKNNEGYDHQVDSWSVGVIVFSMLTNTAPFIEDERIADLKLRILHRTIDWETLFAMNLSHDCVDFVQRLLERDVRKRMTLKDSLSHPWLSGYIPIYQRRELARAGSQGSLAGSSTSTLHRVVREDSSMSVDGLPPSQASAPSTTSSHPPHIPGAYPPSLDPNTRHTPSSNGGVASPGNKGLLRRAHVLAQAAEEGSQLFEPPAEMVKEEEVRRRDAENAPPRHVTPAPSRTRAGKRKAPVQDHYVLGGSAAAAVADDAVMAEPAEPAPNKRVRGRGRSGPIGGGMVTRKRGSQSTPEDGEELQSSQGGPRRSTRKRP